MSGNKQTVTPPKRRRQRWPPWAHLFLEELRKDGVVLRAADRAGIARNTAYKLRTADETFKDAWEEAEYEGSEVLINEAHRRAVEGVEKPVYQGGRLVGMTTEYSDTLLLALIRAKRADKYGQRIQQELTGAKGGPIEVRAIDYRAHLAPLAPIATSEDGSVEDSDASGEDQDRGMRSAVGQDDDV